ncbi:MAG: hypothetical protein HC930_10450 [Hydrococcus sp. SU_1_0]|nr:hypothetical protein [Hydrococcus sp. SU_1_0]
MEKPIVEQHRESYPMTFYPDSLAKTLARVHQVEEHSNSIFHLEPIPLIIKEIHYYNKIGLMHFIYGGLTIFLLATTIVSILFFDKLIATAFLLFTLISFFCYCSLQKNKNNLRKQLIRIEQKLSSRQYKIKNSSITHTTNKKGSTELTV